MFKTKLDAGLALRQRADVYLASFSFFSLGNLLRLLFGLIQLIGSTHPKFDVCPTQQTILA